MWISRIELINFKSYIHQKFQFSKPENGRNLVLIGGMNGFGKTTLLEAIYLCFYGSDAVAHLARAGLHSDAYGKFLKKALHGKAISLKRNMMEVVIAFQTDDADGYEVSRRWHFDLQGSYQEEEIKIYKLRDGLRGNPVAKEELTAIFDDYVVPAHLAPFFFFDGEEVKKLADQDRREWIQQGMENLLGVVLLRGLRDRLEQYQNTKKPSGKSSMDEEKLDELYRGLTIQEQQLEDLRTKQLRFIEQRGDTEERRDEVHRRLSAIGAGGGGVKQVENIVREEGEKREALNKSDAAIDKILSDKLPFHLVSKQIVDDLKFQLQEEAILLDWENKKHSVEPQKERFVEAFFSTDYTQPMDKQTKDKLHESIDFAWQGLFNPKPEGCAKELLHDYLEPRQRQRLNDQFEKVIVGYREIKTLLQQRHALQRAIQELERERIRFEALHDDGTLHQLQEEMKTVQTELDKLNLIIGDMNRHITEVAKNVADQRSTYEREHSKFIETTPIKSNLRKSERVISLIKELMPRLFSIKTKELSNSVTTIFKQLSHKQQVDRIEIDEKGASRLLSYEGVEITVDRAAGENQIFATALIAGLAKTSGFHIPMVVDTPLGRLDSEHRKRILKYWLSDPDRQIILLSQDEEITSEVFSNIHNYVSKTYLLKHEQLGEGIGKTVAYENKYFGEEV